MAEMDRIHTKHPYMGQRKIVKKLEDAGFKVGPKLYATDGHLSDLSKAESLKTQLQGRHYAISPAKYEYLHA